MPQSYEHKQNSRHEHASIQKGTVDRQVACLIFSFGLDRKSVV